MIRVARHRGVRVLNWSVHPRYSSRATAGAILHGVVDGVTPGAMILLHDEGGDRSATVRLLPTSIEALRGRGYGFRTP